MSFREKEFYSAEQRKVFLKKWPSELSLKTDRSFQGVDNLSSIHRGMTLGIKTLCAHDGTAEAPLTSTLFQPTRESERFVSPGIPSRIALNSALFSATGWLSYCPAPPVHWLACIPGYTPFQALSAQSGPTAGEVAGAVWWERGTHRGPLPVSTTECLQAV